MEVEVGVNNSVAGPVSSSNASEERAASVTAVDPNTLTPSAMLGLRDIGSQVSPENMLGWFIYNPVQCPLL